MNRITMFAATAISALGIALAPVPAAADPDAEDIAKVIAGLAVAGIIAKAIDDRDDRKETSRSSSSSWQLGSADDYRYDGRVIEGRLTPWHDGGPKAGRGYKKNPLPQVCLRTLDTGRRDRAVYSAKCLKDNFRFASKLPNECVLRVEGPRGRRTTVYGASCLARDGWIVTTRNWDRERDRDRDRDRRRRSLD